MDDQKFQDALKLFQGKKIDEKTQGALNKPWSDPKTALTPEEKAFLENLIKRIESGDIKVYAPSSILNQEVYDKLSPENKAKTDVWIQATLAAIRRTSDFFYNPFDNNSDMMIDMVKDLMSRKTKLENEIGDVLKI